MDTLRRLYMIVVQNICKAREKLPKKEEGPHNFKVNDMVLVKDPDAAVFEPRYQPNFRVTAIFSNNRIEVHDKHGHKSIRRSAHVKYIEPSEKIVKQLPSEKVLKNYGRSAKLLLTAKDIPDLQFDAAEQEEKGESSERTDVMEIMDVETKRNMTVSQNSDFREHSKNLLESIAGEAQQQTSEQRGMEKVMDPEVHKRTSEYREHSQNSWSSEKATDEETSRKTVHQMFERDVHLGKSENQEHFQNSLPNDEPKANTGEANVSLSAHDGQCLAASSKLREVSSNSQVERECSQGTHHKQSAKNVCISEPSNFSRDSLEGVGSNVSVPKFSWFKSMSQIVGLTAAWQQSKVEGNSVGATTACNAKINPNPVHTEFNFFL